MGLLIAVNTISRAYMTRTNTRKRTREGDGCTEVFVMNTRKRIREGDGCTEVFVMNVMEVPQGGRTDRSAMDITTVPMLPIFQD